VDFFTRLWNPAKSDAEHLGWAYLYDEEGSLLGEYGMGGAQSAGQSQYIYLPTAQGPIPMAAEIDSRLYAIHTDHLGTPRRLTQADGQAAWQWAYTPYGDEAPTLGAKRFTNETTSPTTGATNIAPVRFNLRYPGQYFDEESGLHYNYFRSYDPRTGRYTQGDPIGLDGGWNRFAYVGGDPLLFADPDGLYRRPQEIIPLGSGGGAVVPPSGGGRGGGAGTGSSGRPGRLPIPPIVTTGEKADPHERPWRTRDTWHVYVSCHVKKEAICENCPEFIGGHAYGGTFTEANARAQSDANANLSYQGASGCQARHCKAIACYVNGREMHCPRPQ